MATDNEIEAILTELRATLDQLTRAGGTWRVANKDGVLWIGVINCREQRGRFVYDSTAALAAEVEA